MDPTQLLGDTKKTNLRIIEISEKSQDKTNGIENLFTQIMTEDFCIGKEINVRISEAYRTLNNHTQKSTSVRGIKS